MEELDDFLDDGDIDWQDITRVKKHLPPGAQAEHVDLYESDCGVLVGVDPKPSYEDFHNCYQHTTEMPPSNVGISYCETEPWWQREPYDSFRCIPRVSRNKNVIEEVKAETLQWSGTGDAWNREQQEDGDESDAESVASVPSAEDQRECREESLSEMSDDDEDDILKLITDRTGHTKLVGKCPDPISYTVPPVMIESDGTRCILSAVTTPKPPSAPAVGRELTDLNNILCKGPPCKGVTFRMPEKKGPSVCKNITSPSSENSDSSIIDTDSSDSSDEEQLPSSPNMDSEITKQFVENNHYTPFDAALDLRAPQPFRDPTSIGDIRPKENGPQKFLPFNPLNSPCGALPGMSLSRGNTGSSENIELVDMQLNNQQEGFMGATNARQTRLALPGISCCKGNASSIEKVNDIELIDMQSETRGKRQESPYEKVRDSKMKKIKKFFTPLGKRFSKTKVEQTASDLKKRMGRVPCITGENSEEDEEDEDEEGRQDEIEMKKLSLLLKRSDQGQQVEESESVDEETEEQDRQNRVEMKKLSLLLKRNKGRQVEESESVDEEEQDKTAMRKRMGRFSCFNGEMSEDEIEMQKQEEERLRRREEWEEEWYRESVERQRRAAEREREGDRLQQECEEEIIQNIERLEKEEQKRLEQQRKKDEKDQRRQHEKSEEQERKIQERQRKKEEQKQSQQQEQQRKTERQEQKRQERQRRKEEQEQEREREKQECEDEIQQHIKRQENEWAQREEAIMPDDVFETEEEAAEQYLEDYDLGIRQEQEKVKKMKIKKKKGPVAVVEEIEEEEEEEEVDIYTDTNDIVDMSCLIQQEKKRLEQKAEKERIEAEKFEYKIRILPLDAKQYYRKERARKLEMKAISADQKKAAKLKQALEKKKEEEERLHLRRTDEEQRGRGEEEEEDEYEAIECKNSKSLDNKASLGAMPIAVISNPSNMCFAISGLQLLANIRPYDWTCNDTHPIFRAMCENKSIRDGDETHNRIKILLRDIGLPYYIQQDVQEFLIYFMQRIHSKTEAQGLSMASLLLNGLQRDFFYCSRCPYQNEKFTTFQHLVCHVQNFPIDLSKETAEYNEEWKCNYCGNLGCAPKSRIVQFPMYLFILVGRFINMEAKNETPVDVSKTLRGNGILYNLIGFIDHYGSTPKSGHYVANVLRNKWLRYNDDKVEILNSLPVKSKTVYILLYRRSTETP